MEQTGLSIRHQEIAAILLAAGRSQRMGAFKPLLPFGDGTVIESCLNNLQAAGIEQTIVVLGHRADDLQAHLARWPVRFALNLEPGSAMGVSIACGVEQLPPGVAAVLIALVDQPAVPPAVIRAVIEAWAGGQGRLIVPEYGGRGGHPVLLSLDWRAELLRLDAGRGLRGFFETHRGEVRRVPVDSPYVRRDVDTWEDYCALHREIFGVLPPPNATTEFCI